jgi:hypothetical protein
MIALACPIASFCAEIDAVRSTYGLFTYFASTGGRAMVSSFGDAGYGGEDAVSCASETSCVAVDGGDSVVMVASGS